MDKNTVKKSISIGAISRIKASEDFFTARRHSSAGVRALLWATSSAKSLGCSLGSDFETSRENIFPNILTPGSIPQFTIPSLAVHSSSRSLDKDTEDGDPESEDDFGSSESNVSASLASFASSSSTHTQGLHLVPSDRRAERSVSDPSIARRSLLQRQMSQCCSYSEAQHCLDPASRAALSLPHLAKVTTPYGFVTLSQSPQMASEEALLCQAGLRRLNMDEDTAGCLSKVPLSRTVDKKGHSSHMLGDKKRLVSQDSAASQKKERSAVGETIASPAPAINPGVLSSTLPHPTNSDGKRKRRFYQLIKKHFSSSH